MSTLRVVADIPEELHRKLKTYCASNGISIKTWVMMMAEACLDADDTDENTRSS